MRAISNLGLRKAHIVGYSMGANLTARLLTEHPEPFLSATLGGASGRRRWSAAEDRWAETVASEMEQGSMRSLMLRLAPPHEPKPTDGELRKWSADQLAGQDRLALAAVTRAHRYTVVTDAQMAAVTLPTLAVIGSADPGLTGVRALKRVMTSLTVVVIEGATHATAVGRPEFAQAIRDFVTRSRGPREGR